VANGAGLVTWRNIFALLTEYNWQAFENSLCGALIVALHVQTEDVQHPLGETYLGGDDEHPETYQPA
jgi:hypothetical protein